VKRLQARGGLVVGVIAALLFVGILTNPRFDYEALPLAELITAIEAGEVQEIVVHDATNVSAIYADGTQVRTTKPADMQLLAEINLSPAVERALLYREEYNPLGQVIRAGALIILPLIAITMLYLAYIKRGQAAAR
jgi:hypothetical protein